MRTILIDCRYFNTISAVWGGLFHVLPSYSSPALPAPVCSHPDMTLFDAGEKTFVCAPEAYDYYRRLLSGYGVKLVQGETVLSSHYPADIAYNVARAGKCLIGHKTYADPAILRIAKENGLSFYPTRQGYAKCSSCIISENALITSDPSIARSAQDAGLDVLSVRGGGVLLPGYDAGFLGGACGLLSSGELLCFGDITAHPDYCSIRSFCVRRGVSLRYLKNRPLTDIGTILSIDG